MIIIFFFFFYTLSPFSGPSLPRFGHRGGGTIAQPFSTGQRFSLTRAPKVPSSVAAGRLHSARAPPGRLRLINRPTFPIEPPVLRTLRRRLGPGTRRSHSLPYCFPSFARSLSFFFFLNARNTEEDRKTKRTPH